MRSWEVRPVVAAAVLLLAGLLAACSDADSGETPVSGDEASIEASASASAEPDTNGVEDLGPRQAVAAGVRAMRTYDTFTYEGNTLYPVNGRNHKVPTTWTISANGSCEILAHGGVVGRFVLRGIGDRMYTAASDKGWRAVFDYDDDLVKRFHGKWLSYPRPKGVVAGCEFNQLFPVGKSMASFRDDGVVDVGGIPARKLTGRHLDKRWSVLVATEGEQRILRVLGHDATGPMRMDLVKAGPGPAVAVPPEGKTIASDAASA